jgi:putative endonuclease
MLSWIDFQVFGEVYYVYVVRCANGSLYTGYTKDIDKRIATHNEGKGGRYTKAHRPVELIASWSFITKREALQIEHRIKQLPRQKKLELVRQPDIPKWLLDGK